MNRKFLLALSVALHAYVGGRLIPSLGLWPWAIVLVAVMLVLTFSMLHLGVFFYRRRHRYSDQVSWASMTAMGLFSSLLVFTLLRDALSLILAAVALAWPATAMQNFAAGSALAVPLATLLVTAIGMWNARRTAAVVNVEIPIAGLPAALHGFTIAQISDVHVGATIKGPYVDSIVDAVNRLDADMVAVTGDLVDGPVADLARHVSPLARLASRHGTFFVTGNHE